MSPDVRTLILIFLGFVLLICVILMLLIIDPLQPWKTRHCKHEHARCLHGDEILARMKVYSFRFWKPEITYRQVCIDCGRALDRVAICTATGKDQHEWNGPWPDAYRDERGMAS